jgi:uncharacterized protein (DUF952 family)
MTSAETTIYKVTTGALFARAEAEGHLPPSPIDEKDGFMHFSTAGQLRETLRLHFAGESNLMLCAVPVAPIAAKLKWEPSRGGALFPHLYAALPLSAVAAHYPVSVAKDGSCFLPEGFD